MGKQTTLKSRPMPSSRWPTENELEGVSEVSLSYNMVWAVCVFSFYLSNFILFFTVKLLCMCSVASVFVFL